jgi:hypothetical protein
MVTPAGVADLTAEALMRKRAVRATQAGYTVDHSNPADSVARVLVTLTDGSRWQLIVLPEPG